MANIIHIVSFNVPYPPDYGGVIDVFYKIKSFNSIGVKVILHCYKYGRSNSTELEKICYKVYYYNRKLSINKAFDTLPFIVKTRNSKTLYNRLEADNYPIIFEGLHTTFWLPTLAKKKRVLTVRTHNIEHEYYSGLYKSEKNILKKIYFNSESKKLKKYESVLTNATQLVALTEKDCLYFKKINSNSSLIPAFHPFSKVEVRSNKDDYILFHGDLTVSDNIKSAIFLVKNIFSDLGFKFIIAGKNPSSKLINLVNGYNNVQIISNPSDIEIKNLISKAKINLLYSFQNTGIKLKLLYCLYVGGYCIANSKVVSNSGLNSLCKVADSESEIKKSISELFYKKFTVIEIEKREKILSNLYDNKKNILKFCNILFK